MLRDRRPFLSVNHRLAPESHGRMLAEDTFAGLTWLLQHSSNWRSICLVCQQLGSSLRLRQRKGELQIKLSVADFAIATASGEIDDTTLSLNWAALRRNSIAAEPRAACCDGGRLEGDRL
jgi:hypothetical protein